MFKIGTFKQKEPNILVINITRHAVVHILSFWILDLKKEFTKLNFSTKIKRFFLSFENLSSESNE